jgi:hypothetical protein
MRTTLDIEDDVLMAAKELGRHERRSVGQVISALARQALQGRVVPETGEKFVMKNGVPVRPSRGEIITLEHVQKIMDEEGI